MCDSHTNTVTAALSLGSRLESALGPPGGSLESDPEQVLRRVCRGPRGNGVCMGTVKFIESDAVKRNPRVMDRQLELPCRLGQVDVTAASLECVFRHLSALHSGGRDCAPVRPSYPTAALLRPGTRACELRRRS